MIAVDSNVLLRYLLGDDAGQTQQAAALFGRSEPVLVTDVVLVETVWTLKGRKYRLGKDGIVHLLNALFEERAVRFEDGQTVWRALQDYKKCRPVSTAGKRREADFPDALVVNTAKQYARDNNEPFQGLFTFDVAARALPGTKKP